MKKIYLTESDLHRIINESVRRVLKEYNQFSDGDFGGTGDPYGLTDDAEFSEIDRKSLNGDFHDFNNIWVDIRGDGKPNVFIVVGSKQGDERAEFDGGKAQAMLDKIRSDAKTLYDGSIFTAIYQNLYKYVL